MAGRDGQWGGFFLVEAASPQQTKTIANMLNTLCIMGAAGERRVAVTLRHDYDGNRNRKTYVHKKSIAKARDSPASAQCTKIRNTCRVAESSNTPK